MVTANVRIQNQKIEQTITSLYRVKDGKAREWLVYNIILSALNYKGEQITFDDVVGKVGGIPVFTKKINPDSEEIEYSSDIHDHKTVYSISFSKQKVDELSKYFTDSVQFAIEGLGCGGRTYSCSFEELRDLEWDELVKAKTAYLKSDYYRNKQLLAGGVT